MMGSPEEFRGDFLEPILRELKIPLTVLCILSDGTESMGLSGLRTN